MRESSLWAVQREFAAPEASHVEELLDIAVKASCLGQRVGKKLVALCGAEGIGQVDQAGHRADHGRERRAQVVEYGRQQGRTQLLPLLVQGFQPQGLGELHASPRQAGQVHDGVKAVVVPVCERLSRGETQGCGARATRVQKVDRCTGYIRRPDGGARLVGRPGRRICWALQDSLALRASTCSFNLPARWPVISAVSMRMAAVIASDW